MLSESDWKALDALTNPRSVAVIGASRDPESVGQGVLQNLLQGSVLEGGYWVKPFAGKIFPINPNAHEILGRKCFPSVAAVPDEIDLAIVCVPARVVPLVLRECGEKKIRAAIVISAGFAEVGAKGARLQEKVLRIARAHSIRILGPNTLGIIRPPVALNASFAPTSPPSGDVAFITQSGALADSEIDIAIKERYSFSAIVSLGNQADLDAADFVEWAARDVHTRSIALYLEGLRDGRKFMRAARAAACSKPIIVLKGGVTAQGTRAASSHTAVLAGSPLVFESALRQSGCLVAESFEELFDLAKALAWQPRARRNAVAIVTNGGGAGVLLADYCAQFGVQLVELSRETVRKLDASELMHPAWSKRNPVDIIGDALPERYRVAVNTLLDDKSVSALVVAQTMQTMTNPLENARVVIESARKHPEKPVVCLFMGGKLVKKSIELLRRARIPDYNDPRKAARAIAALCGAQAAR